MNKQVAILWVAVNGYLDEVAVERVREFETEFIQYVRAHEKKLLPEIADKKVLDEDMIKRLEKVTKDFVKTFSPEEK